MGLQLKLGLARFTASRYEGTWSLHVTTESFDPTVHIESILGLKNKTNTDSWLRISNLPQQLQKQQELRDSAYYGSMCIYSGICMYMYMYINVYNMILPSEISQADPPIPHTHLSSLDNCPSWQEIRLQQRSDKEEVTARWSESRVPAAFILPN